MTHGEEPGPETHKDSAVLTYLEGLLMHPVVAGPGATAGRRSEAVRSNHEQGNKVGASCPLTNHSPAAPKAGSNGPTLGPSQHLKKARLLRSGAWNDPGNHTSPPPVELNGQAGGLQNGSAQAGESTLLASLLQSFSSRLQSVAMSQHSANPSTECPAPSPSKAPPADQEPLPVYGTASSRLKGLMRKSKLQNHNSTPYSRRGHGQDRPPESPRSAHSATPPAASTTAESVSCTERLKAVANMVKIRSSPAPSPKPSVACSQLALLLSSEAHLQQYSREHALKAQLSGRSASERLAAMANQQHGQDRRSPSVGGAADTLTSSATPNGMTAAPSVATLPRTAVSSPHSPPLSSPPTPSQPPREKRGFDSRPARPPQTCSSLLLLLLNNQKQLTKNGHLEDLLPHSGSSSVTSDSESSAHERSVAKDNSDAESSYSICSPIDLSVRGRGSVRDSKPHNAPPSFLSSTSTLSSSLTALSSSTTEFCPQASTQSCTASLSPSSLTVSSASTSTCSASSSSSFSTSSLDKLTQSLINKWKPEPSRTALSSCRDPELSPEPKAPPKLTLMQLLLERKNNEMANQSSAKQDLPLDVTMATMSRGQHKGLMPWEESRTRSPLERPVGPPQPLYPLSRDPSSALSPYSYPSPHVQSSPLDLCKSKPFPAETPAEPTFSASKLLQNLAQCGSSSSCSTPTPSSKALPQDLEASRPHNLLERLNAPVQRTTSTPLSDGASGSTTPFSHKQASPPSSQIENLLERRTVLQLLLGTASAASTLSRKDRPTDSDRRGPEVSVGPSSSSLCDSANGPLLDVKIKSEVLEEGGPFSFKSEEVSSRKRLSEKRSPRPDPQQDLKTEPRPAEVIAKYGLLSQLLKQQTASYYSCSAAQADPPLQVDPQHQQVEVKEEQRGYSPKRRRVSPEQTHPGNSAAPPTAGENMSASSSAQVVCDQQRGPKEEEAPPSETLSRESRGFNVLKQLLLSDNCLKELSQQQRGAPSPAVLQANGSAPPQPPHNHSFLHLPTWPPHSSFNSGLPSHLRPLPTPPPGDGPIRSPWLRQPAPWTLAQKREPPTLVKQEPQSPLQWSSQENEGEEEACDSHPDSPRLSRSNPILYYMLQKGSVHLRKGARPAEDGGHPVVRVKEEQTSELQAYEGLNSSPPSPPHHDKHSHESQGLSQSSH